MAEYLEKCSICGTPFKSSIFRGRHLREEHEMSLEDYVVKTIYNGIKPKCKCGCGKDLKFTVGLTGTWYYEYVYNHSPRKKPSEETKKRTVEKIKKTNLERYGHECSAHSTEIKEKIKKTNLERYGVEHPMRNPEIYAKVKKTLNEKYGIDNPMQNEEFRKKAIEFNKIKYGVENPFQNKEIKEKIKKTNLERYGVEHASQNEDIKRKVIETNLEKYGVEHHLQVPEIYAKAIKTNLERYGVEKPLQNTDLFEKMKKDNLQKYGHEYIGQVEEFKQKINETNLEKYGSSSPFGSKEVQKKSKETSLERYGHEYAMQNKEVFIKSQDTLFKNHGVRHTFHKLEFYNKFIQTNIEKYGFKNPMQNEDIREKVKQTNLLKYGVESPFQMTNFKKLYNPKNSKIELEICEKLGGEHAFNYLGKEYDIKLGNNLFEIDGDYWHTSNLLNLNLITLCSVSNDFNKINDCKDSEYNLHKIFISNLPKEITEENLIKNSYIPNFELNYEDIIVSKEYLQDILQRNGKEYLEKYLKYFITFIKTFQPTFPYHKSSQNIDEIIGTIRDYKKYDTVYQKENKTFLNSSFSIGTTYLKAMFHSYWKSSYRGNKTPVQMWENEKIMTNVIKYRIGVNNSNEVYDFSLKNLVKGISAIRGTISFFKPIVAACIYKEFLKNFSQEETPKVFDPCCGFGGRMLGFKSSFPNGIYVGCEPNVETYNELLELSKNFTNVTIYNCKLEDLEEDVVESLQNVDLSFTSVPYFDLETYSNAMEYENIKQWQETFINSLYKFPNLLLNIPKDLEYLFKDVKDVYFLKNSVSKHLNKKESDKNELILKFF